MPGPQSLKRPFDEMSTGWNGQQQPPRPEQPPQLQYFGSNEQLPPGSLAASRSYSIIYPDAPNTKLRRSTVDAIYSYARGSVSFPSAPLDRPSFEHDASIIIIGVRGVGKSTLAVIASTALRRRIVEADKIFQETRGMPSAAFQREHGVPAYRKAQVEVLEHILDKYSRDAIIVCSWMEREVQARFAQCTAFPVVLILRDTPAIQEHLRGWGGDKVRDLVTAIVPVFRRCARFEFYNITEKAVEQPLPPPLVDSSGHRDSVLDTRPPAPNLALKRAERHFLKFLSLILPKGTLPFYESAFPLASSVTEDRNFTYALTLRLSDYLKGAIDVEEIEYGADAIELVVECALDESDNPLPMSTQEAEDISRGVGLLRRSTVVPLITHVVLPDPSKPSSSQNSAYVSRVLHCLRLAPDYVTIDLRLPDSDIARIRTASFTPRIIGHASFDTQTAPSWLDPIWTAHYQQALDSGCHLVRLTKYASSMEDNFEVAQFSATARSAAPGMQLPLIAYNTGPYGRFSACFNKILTSVKAEEPESSKKSPSPDGIKSLPSSPALSRSSLASSPSLTALDATRALSSSFVYEPLKLYVFGANVDYSISPAMHNAALQAIGIPHGYRPYSTTSVARVRTLIHDHKFGGASVGLPFKVEAISLSDSLSSHARAVGAVNTLIPVRQLNPDGSVPDYNQLLTSRNQSGPVKAIFGENTDWIGIRACIRRGLSPANAVRKSTVGLVIGAGGMARAAVYAMLQLGVKQIVVFNRTVPNAQRMVSHFAGMLERNEMQLLSEEPDIKPRFHILATPQSEWPAGFRMPTMIISCIPTHSIGSNPSPDFTVPTEWLSNPTGGVVVELAYKTLSTPLLAQVKDFADKGWVSLDGLDLLPEQGFAQFELFTGRRAPRRLMRQEVFKAHKDEEGRSNLPQLQTRLDWIVNQDP